VVAAECLPTYEERLKVKYFDCMTVQEDPFWEDVQSRHHLLESADVLAEIVEEKIEVV
jgi:hypothetical protein